MKATVRLEGELTEFRTEKKPTKLSRTVKGKGGTLSSRLDTVVQQGMVFLITGLLLLCLPLEVVLGLCRTGCYEAGTELCGTLGPSLSSPVLRASAF